MRIGKPNDTAFNVGLMVVDDLLGKSVPVDRAIYLAGNKLLELQKEHTWFDRNDLNWALESFNHLLAAHKKSMGPPPPAKVIPTN